MTSIDTSQRATTRRARIRALVARATAMEKTVYGNIGRAITRRPAVPVGGKGFRYSAPVLTILWIFIILSAVELVVLDLLVHQWLVVRVICLVISIWGLVWMIGLLCGYFMRPHTVGPDGFEIRDGLDLDLRISWDDVHSVAISKHTYEPKTPKFITDGDHEVLVIGVLNETNIEIVLEGPTSVTVPSMRPEGGERAVTVVRFWADDPKALLDEVRNHL